MSSLPPVASRFAAGPVIRMRWSAFGMSAWRRLAIALAILAGLWLAVLWAMAA